MAAELELAVGDRVVYPGQGVCKVLAITEKVLAGERVDVVALAREEDGAQVLVPKSKILSVGVRKLAAFHEEVGHFLTTGEIVHACDGPCSFTPDDW